MSNYSSRKNYHVRQQRLTIYDHLYSNKGQIGDPCVYCGCHSDTMDHVPPISYAAMKMDVDLYDDNLRKYPSCMECNRALGSKPFTNLRDRRACVNDYLRKKYKSLLGMPAWDDEELEEMSPEMQRDIRAAERLKNQVQQRILWPR